MNSRFYKDFIQARIQLALHVHVISIPISAISGKAPLCGLSGPQTHHMVVFLVSDTIIQVKRILRGSFFDPDAEFFLSVLWYIHRKRKFIVSRSAGFSGGKAGLSRSE